jgi:serine/threonine-protein kinase
MLNCPVCDTPNAEGSVSCENCSRALPLEFDAAATVISNDQQTVVASSGALSSNPDVCAFRAELRTGEVVCGRYEIVARLGQGGMGTVYKVLDRELDRFLALKTIRPDLVTNAGSLRRLKQEVLLSRQISHRNVIRVYNLDVAEGLRFILMEFVEGEDLKAILNRRKKLPYNEALEIVTQVCAGLAAAHAEDVVHRDLKPQNVLMSPDGRVRLVDFGLAKSFQDPSMTQTGAVLGTPAYMSPEQALGQPGDARSDIFSFGVLAFEILTGELPFPGRSLSEAYLSRTRGRARPIESVDPTIPVWLGRIIMRCLQVRVADRYQSAADVLTDITAGGTPSSESKSASGVLSPGAMLGARYRIDAEVGEGGFGKVYRATDLELHRTVALKVVRPELTNNPDTVEQLKHEITIASQISHKNVLRIHDIGEADGLRFVSMAWAEGEDLSQLLARTGTLPEAQVLLLAQEMCEGLEAAHEQGITHRDLKPGNILLTASGHACIADFGLAYTADVQPVPHGGSGETHGTPRYMSPEQVEGTPLDPRTDIYSLGLILYEMSTGRIPFKDDSVLQTMAERVSTIPPSPKLYNSGLSDRLSSMILRCIERDPAKRFGNVHELLEEIRNARSVASTVAAPILPSRRGWRTRLSRPYVAAALLAAVVITGVFLERKFKPSPPPLARGGKYVAVLPFRAIGVNDPNLTYRAEGIADAVQARLASLKSVQPISSYAVSQVNFTQHRSQDDIGKQLGANRLITGSVQEQNNSLRVNAAIYDTQTKRQIWSKSYAGSSEDLFAMEDDICNGVIEALEVTPTLEDRKREEHAPTGDLEAYDLYLKGRDIIKKGHRNENDAKAALDLFEQATRKDNSFALAWTGVADANLQLYHLTKNDVAIDKAVNAAEQARDRNPNLPEVHFALGSVYSAKGRLNEATDEIKKALTLAPNSDDGYIRLGRVYLARGMEELALNAYRKAVELNPYYWYNHKQLGVAYYNLGHTDLALKEFKEQVSANPKDPSGFNNIGAIYLKQGKWKEAVPELLKAIQLQPNPDAYSNLATAYYHLGRVTEAIPQYLQSLKLNPNQAEVVRNLAEAYDQSGQHGKADQATDRAMALLFDQLRINPRDSNSLGTLAVCYAAKKEYERARELIARARRQNPADSTLMYDEALIDAGDGRITEALTALKTALEHGYSYEYTLSDPGLKKVRESPGFKSLEKKFGQTVVAARR